MKVSGTVLRVDERVTEPSDKFPEARTFYTAVIADPGLRSNEGVLRIAVTPEQAAGIHKGQELELEIAFCEVREFGGRSFLSLSASKDSPTYLAPQLVASGAAGGKGKAS